MLTGKGVTRGSVGAGGSPRREMNLGEGAWFRG